MEFLTENWSSLALALITALSSYTALTETTKDDKIVNVLSRVLNAIIFGKSRSKKNS